MSAGSLMNASKTSDKTKNVMHHPRLFARMRPSGRISSIAEIFAGAGASAVDCILVDYSAGGACLQLKAFIALPDRFDVLYGTTRKHCRVVWKRGLRIGVTF
jgi:hypothetical protein